MKKKRTIRLLLLAVVLVIATSACSRKSTDEKLALPYEKYTLSNGLQVILHVDKSDPVISYAVMYHVGSSREEKQKTGFAHLYEHLLFQGSENVAPGMFDKIIEGAGGQNNGGTNRDVTTYFEIFPKNALEKILWLESDRMGFFINSVTQRALAIQQNVVQNEKRQGKDNTPYGFTWYTICKTLYPEDHPYNWEVIGEMEDLKNAGLNNVRSFYEKYYGPNNATIVLGGDFDIDSVKPLIEKYFGEIKPHGEVTGRTPWIPKPDKTIKVYYEDNFANVPELTMVWPVPEVYNKDAYALDFLAKILADGKKTPMYKVLIKEKQLTSKVSAINNNSELAGEFILKIRANEGKNLKDIESTVFEAFQRFEKEGIRENDIEKIKAISEKSFYLRLNSVLNKSLQLAFYNTFRNDPGYYIRDIENIKAVTPDDVLRVYNTYIKGEPYVASSIVPKGKPEMVAESSIPFYIKEENIENASQVEIGGIENDSIVKTPSSFNRELEPVLAKDPEVNLPVIWKEKLANGIEVYGIEQNELPLVNIDIVFDGGVYMDNINLPGVANLVSTVMPLGTKGKTAEELEEEIKRLGSNINMSTSSEEIVLSANMLSKNFEKTLSLMEEIVLEPRWDEEEFNLAQSKTLNSVIQDEVQPRTVAALKFNRLLYGDQHIFGYNPKGTRESLEKITIGDLKKYCENNFSPSLTKIHIAGNISREKALNALKSFEAKWMNREVNKNFFPQPSSASASKIYFSDLPGSKQSVIYVGELALSRNDADYTALFFANYRLGGAFTSILNQILREEKGFTYGAFSFLPEQKEKAPFMINTSVRSGATLESLDIIKENLEKYADELSLNDLLFTKNYLVRSNAGKFETLPSKLNMLMNISKYGLSDDYVKKEEEMVKNMTIEKYKETAKKYMNPDRMIYLVVGDAVTQMKSLEQTGMGKAVLLK